MKEIARVLQDWANVTERVSMSPSDVPSAIYAELMPTPQLVVTATYVHAAAEPRCNFDVSTRYGVAGVQVGMNTGRLFRIALGPSFLSEGPDAVAEVLRDILRDMSLGTEMPTQTPCEANSLNYDVLGDVLPRELAQSDWLAEKLQSLRDSQR